MTEFSSASAPATPRAGCGSAPGPERGVRREDFALPASASAVAQARERVCGQLRRWNLPQELDDLAQLVVSEFFTNAVLHTESRQVRCHLRAYGERLRIEVSDEGAGHGEVAPRAGSEDDVDGRGLQLVNAVAEKWGVRAPTGHPGRVVWADL